MHVVSEDEGQAERFAAEPGSCMSLLANSLKIAGRCLPSSKRV